MIHRKSEAVSFSTLWFDLHPTTPCPSSPREGLPAQAHSPTSRAAAASLPNAETLRALVLRAIVSHGGLTDERGMIETGISPNCYRPRRVELVEAGLVRDSGETRPTVSGRQAVVWKATEKASTLTAGESGRLESR